MKYYRLLILLSCVLCVHGAKGGGLLEAPVLDGDWWRIGENAPDVSPYNTKKHNACDFSIWQAADGVWQLVSCIRETSYPGSTRLFHRWESTALTNENWTPKGIFAVSDPEKLGHTEGRMQAPHCFLHEGQYLFFYNSYGAYCKASADGKNFTDIKSRDGSYRFFDMGRDLMIFHNTLNAQWYAFFEYRGRMAARTARHPLGPWSKQVENLGHKGNPESPFMIQRGDDFYLWEQMNVFHSKDPMKFTERPIAHMTGIWYHGKYAPEIIIHDGQYYIAGYGKGLWLARMQWEPRTMEEINAWRDTEFTAMEARREEARGR